MATLADLISDDTNLSSVRDVLVKSGLLDSISGTGPFTLFLPNNDAMNLMPNKEQFLSDMENVKKILKFHVVQGEAITSIQVKDDMVVKTANGNAVDVSNENDVLSVNGAKVTMRDKVADNGVLHIIDRVLTPPLA